MCCDPRIPVTAAPTAAGCGCGCNPGRSGRRFFSREEQAEKLRAYREELLREAAEVERRIAALAKE